MTWSSSNLLNYATGTDATGSESVSFWYGPDRQRVRQHATGPSGYETTYYAAGLFEQVSTT